VQQRAAFAAGTKWFGRIDAVFMNAGIAEYGDQFFEDEFDADGHLKGLDRSCSDITVKLAIYHLRKYSNDGQV